MGGIPQSLYNAMETHIQTRIIGYDPGAFKDLQGATIYTPARRIVLLILLLISLLRGVGSAIDQSSFRVPILLYLRFDLDGWMLWNARNIYTADGLKLIIESK
jgi:hypothetical protein